MGKRVRDVYGRYTGFVVGLTTDPFGELRSVGVDSGERGLVEHAGQCIALDGDSLVLYPTWRVEADRFRKEASIVNTRALAVDELLKEGEISQEEYQEFLKVYQGYRAKLEDVKKVLDEKIKRRLQDLDREAKDLKRMGTNVKVQFKSGEIDAESFRASLQYSSVMKERIDKERVDIASTSQMLNGPPSASPSRVVEEHIESSVEETPKPVEVTPIQAVEVSTSSIPSEAGWLARFLKGRQ